MQVWQLFSKAFLLAAMKLYGLAAGKLLWSVDRAAFTSGDLPFLMRTWQGWLVIVCGFLALCLYTAVDVNANILMSRRVLQGEKIRLLRVLGAGIAGLRRFADPAGIGAVLYVSLIAPLTLCSIGISLTSEFAVPAFILSFIDSDIWLRILYDLFLLAMNIAGALCVFTFHFVLLGREKPWAAMKSSVRTVWANKKDLILSLLGFYLRSALVVAAMISAAFLLPLIGALFTAEGSTAHRAWIIAAGLAAVLAGTKAYLVFMQFAMLKLTMLYDRCSGSGTEGYQPPQKGVRLGALLTAAGICVISAGFSLPAALNFDFFFPEAEAIGITAHRAGG